MKDLLELLAEYGMKPKDALKAFIGVVQEFSLWLTLALAAVMLIAFVIVWFKKKEALEGFNRRCNRLCCHAYFGYPLPSDRKNET